MFRFVKVVCMLWWHMCYGGISVNHIPKKITSKLTIGCVYTAYIKIRHNTVNYVMLGNQFGFKYNNLNSLDIVFDTIKPILE